MIAHNSNKKYKKNSQKQVFNNNLHNKSKKSHKLNQIRKANKKNKKKCQNKKYKKENTKTRVKSSQQIINYYNNMNQEKFKIVKD